ncbi:MAG: 5-bromo-4-chloroindolyl phosphate hydrolysis family protein [Oscillospiraceae bacterium]|nr:5-bromo-4-chloroindolyl phosphate hydrolysis family protein [Oscillospiraceae bacterium]
MNYDYDPNSGFTPRQNNRPPSNNSDWVGWLLIGLFFITGLWPVGLIMLISKLSDGSSRKKVNRNFTVNTGSNYQRYQQAARDVGAAQQKKTGEAAPSQTVKRSAQAIADLTHTPQYGAKGAKILKLVGAILGISGLLALGGIIGDAISGYMMPEFEDLFYMTGLVAGGASMWLGGLGMQRRARRFAKYLAYVGNRKAIPINDLAVAADVSEAKAEKDLEIMVEKGLWGEGAFVDAGRDMLFLSPEAAEQYYRQQDNPPPPETEEGYSGILRNIRRANDRIADPVLSEKIDRIEEVAGKIFRLIEEQPEKKAKANTFLNYYLPTTQKLLDSYADFEEAGVSGENLTEAKARIADTMDNIVRGFEHQLDELYQAQALDVDSDIRVMEAMLRRDTASAKEDFGLDGGTAVQEADTEIE